MQWPNNGQGSATCKCEGETECGNRVWTDRLDVVNAAEATGALSTLYIVCTFLVCDLDVRYVACIWSLTKSSGAPVHEAKAG